MDGNIIPRLCVCLVLVLHVYCSRFERDTASNGIQPKIVSQDGHLIFMTGANHNITFRPSAGGAINLDGESLQAIVNMVKENKADLEELKSGVGDSDIATRIANLESRIESMVPTERLQEEVDAITTRLDNLYRRSVNLNTRVTSLNTTVISMRRQVTRNRNQGRSLNGRIRSTQRKVRTMERALNRRECNSNPCQHGGTCIDLYKGFHCRCTAQWKGVTCDEDVNECYTLAGTDLGCQNGGTCVNLQGSFRCDCTSNWHGILCSEAHDDCTGASHEALCGHGTCINLDRVVSGQAKYRCLCDDGWTHSDSQPACTVDVDECDGQPFPCSSSPRVTCQNLPGTFHCGPCPNGYSGDGHTCSDINECEINNGGCSPQVQCINTVGSRSCGNCPPGMTGDGVTCSYSGNICGMDNGGCHPLATCTPNHGIMGRSCTCPQGYIGSGVGPGGCVASSQPSPGGCQNNPCLHGTCQVQGQGYICMCQAGWGGTNCNVNINECASNPCQNGGTCVDGVGTFMCSCTSDFTGPTCTQAQQSCGGVLTGESGSFRFPSSSGETYPHGASCGWTINTSPTKIITLSFTQFKLETSRTCSFDFLDIHDGPSRSSHRIGRYCGQTLPNGGSINSTTHQIHLWFKSDNSQSADGFEVHWTSAVPECGGDLRGQDHGAISSPGYPGNYPHNRDCVWTVRVSPGHTIKFTFAYLALEHHANCSYDYLELYDGLTPSSNLLHRYCSSGNPSPIETSGPYARVRFHSDANLNDRGFHITFASESGCGDTLTTDSGVLISPNYPNPYTRNGQCVWTITVPESEQITFTFTNMDLETHPNCRYDYVEVRDGADETSPFVGRYCGTGIPPVLRSSGYSFWIKFKADGSNQGSGFRATWEVECGGRFSTLTGELTSPYFPNSYPHNKVCTYLIDQPAGSTILLTFHTFDIEASSSNENCRYDSLEVRNGGGADSPLLQKLCGSTLPAPISSTTNQLWLQFVSDGSVQNNGFRATYTVDLQGQLGGDTGVTESSGNTTVNIVSTCGGSLSGSAGTFTSPAHPGYYPHGLNCTWYITVQPGFIIRLTFNTFSLESQGQCSYDYVAVYDSNTNTTLLGRYCGSNVPPVLTSTDNVLTVTFRSDHSVTREGFSASYVALNASSACGREIRDLSGVISSPNYPDNYPHNRECEWAIVVPQGRQILVNITNINMELHQDCQYDYLEIHDGGFVSSPLINRFCGRTAGEDRIIRSSSNRLYLKFKSDGSGAGQGFQLQYDGTLSGCGGEITSSTGSIVSPNYPLPYGHRAECFWTITVAMGNRIHMSFLNFGTEAGSSCNYDYLMVRDTSAGGPLLGQFCGTNTPDPVNSRSNKLWMKFRSDHSVSNRGFHLTYHTVCNSRLTAHSGVIESINFPQNYPPNQDCTYVIEATRGNTINASFSHLRLEGHANCAYDYVELRDGEDINGNLIGKYCSNNLPPPIATVSRFLYLHFVTDPSGANIGFRMEYIMNGCGGQFTAPTGVITSPNYPNTYPDGQECAWRIRVTPGSRVQINITDFNVESHQNCSYDALEIYGGMDRSSPRLAQLCHTQTTSQVLTSTGNMVYLLFRSDTSTNGRGFSLNYTAVPGGCGGLFTTQSATISSPNYPNPYPHNTDCLWLIRVAEGRNVQLTFNAFSIEAHATCNYDYVAIYDGPTVNSTRLLKACNSSRPLGERVISTSNMMLLRMRSDGSTALSGFQASYKTGCGGRLSAEEDGEIVSPNYPNTYEKNSNCTWYIQGDHPGDRVTLTFTHMDVENLSNCSHDFVQVLEGNDRSGLEVGKYCGNTVPSPITSQGSAMVVNFVTDLSDERTGFRAIYTKSTSACGARFTAEHGSFNSPRYPDSYPNNVECVWQIRSSPGNRVQLTFSVFNLEEDYLCNTDFVEVREGINGDRLLNRFCGTTLPNNITSGRSLFIKFRSNANITGNGFMAHYTSVYGGALTGESGVLASPQYPGNYPHSVHYVWTITSNVGTRIRIRFTDFQVEVGGSGCTYDYLLIQDGLDSDALILGRFCGTDRPQSIVSTSNTMRITFHTDSSSSGRGFLFIWAASSLSEEGVSPSPPVANSCGGLIQATSSLQNLTSPNYPGIYPHSVNCVWTIRTAPSHVVWFNLTDLHTESHYQCTYDYVAIYSGANTTDPANQIARHCGRTTNTQPILSSSAEMTVQFVSDGSVAYRGFSAQFKQGCGGLLEMEAGTIVSPAFPNAYPTNQNCIWNIKVLSGRTVQVNMQNFNIQGNTPCTGDYLTFYNGGSTDSPVLGSSRYCGATLPTIPESSSNLLTVNFVSDGVSGSNPYKFKFTFREKPVACGGRLFLTASSPSAEIQSPNYPNDYPANLDCVWTIAAPMNERVQLDFLGNLVVEAHHNCTYDYVEVRDGGTSNSVLLGRFCGNVHPDTILSTSSVLYIRFRTDNSLHASGFKAQYKIATCGGTITGSQGFISSPNYPGNYENNMVCEWYIRAPTGHYLTFSFEAFQLESGSDCNVLDNIEIMDNYTGSSLGQFCGNSIPEAVDTSDSMAYIRFTSNAQNTYTGFKLNFEASVEECGGELTTPSGSLTSPNYPGLYAHSRRCTWYITAQQGRRITLTFSDFSLEQHIRCAYDYVRVYNGRLRNSPPLTDRLCGSNNPGTIESSGNTMTVLFVTDGSVSEGGFSASYTSNNPQVCGDNLPYNSAGGQISSPGFSSGANYAARMQCIWVINNRVQSSSSIAMRFSSFSVEMQGQCFYDHVEIREGSDGSGELIGRYCGNDTLPPYLASPSPNIWVQFVSDELINDAGFQLDYSFTSCGGILTAASGVITSPNYPADYGHSDSCAWQIEAPLGSQIKVEFTAFSIERHAKCEYDYIEIFNGGLPSSPSIGRFCGDTTPETFTSQSNRLRIEFHSDNSQSKPGFRLTYRFISDACGGLFHSQDGSLSSPNYPTQYPTNTECVWDLNVQPGYHIEMTFAAPFDLTIQTVCNGDYVEIKEYQKGADNTESWVSLGRFCGSQTPSALKSTTNRVRVKFRSDASNSGNGFSLNYTAGCGAVFTGDTGDILSPGYPGNYDNNLLCNYSIMVDHNKFIVLTFEEELFRIEGRRHKPFLIGPSKGEEEDNSKNSTAPPKSEAVASEELFFPDYDYDENYFDLDLIHNHHHIIQAGFTCVYDWLDVSAGNNTINRHLTRVCGYRAPAALSSQGSMFLQFRTDETITDKGWRASYRAVECGGEFRGPTGQIHTPTHPLNYQHNANCSWTITVDPDRVVELKFTQFHIEAHSTCQYDSVEVYDGDDRDSLMLGRYCGNIAPPPIKSSNNTLFIVFISDSSVSRLGFVAAYRQTFGVSQGCGGLLNASSGTIQSLDYDGDGQYENDLDCVWRIQAPENKVIKLTMGRFILEDSNCINYDHLEIRDGFYKTDPIVGRYCGTRAITEYTSSSNFLYIRFFSDDSIARTGFSLSFVSIDMVCGGVYTVDSSDPQNLTSPNYPNNYPPNSNCRWILTAPTDKQIELTIKDLDIESHDDCIYDYLEIRDSPMGIHGQEHHFCGSQKSSLRSTGSMLQVNLKSDGNSQGRGFLLQYSLASCNRTYSSPSGHVISPGWPNLYPRLQNCLMVITAPEGYKLSLFFNAFGIESHEACQYDNLQIFNGTSDDGEPISTLCGREVPLPIFLEGNSAALKFVSDSSVAYRGFDITYISSLTGCGGTLTAANGTFTSPGYPSNSTATTRTCSYLIQVPARRQISIHFDDLDIPDADYCPQNFVAVYEGSTNISPRLGKYCGTEIPADYTSSSNSVLVEYTTVSSMQGRGFKIRYGSS